MNRSYRILPVYTGDVSGVCAALYELGGMEVIHDPSGCNSTYNTHDETRWYDQDSLIFITGRSEIDAILGNDEKLVSDVADAAMELRPRFIALVNSPIPYLNGTDFPALCRLIQQETGIPTFYVPTNGMHDYVTGGGRALREIAARFAAPAIRQKGTLNLLGVTPLDFAEAGCTRSLRQFAAEQGFSVLSCWAMGDSLDTLAHAGAGEVNLVVSALGLPAAELLYQRFGTPYVCGVPVPGFRDELGNALREAAGTGIPAFPCRDSRTAAAGEWTAIGEPVLMGSLGAAAERKTGCPVRVLSPLEATEALLSEADLPVDGEEEAEAALQTARVIFSDPMYRPVCPAGAKFIPLAHQAFSGRNGWKTMKNPMELDISRLLEEANL